VFVSGKPFQPSLIFEGEATGALSGYGLPKESADILLCLY